MYAIYCTDKPGGAAPRRANREAHLAYVRRIADRVVLAGPLLSDAGEMVGSLLVLDMESRAEVEAFAADDPYCRAGVFESVVIRPFRQVFPE